MRMPPSIISNHDASCRRVCTPPLAVVVLARGVPFCLSHSHMRSHRSAAPLADGAGHGRHVVGVARFPCLRSLARPLAMGRHIAGGFLRRLGAGTLSARHSVSPTECDRVGRGARFLARAVLVMPRVLARARHLSCCLLLRRREPGTVGVGRQPVQAAARHDGDASSDGARIGILLDDLVAALCTLVLMHRGGLVNAAMHELPVRASGAGARERIALSRLRIGTAESCPAACWPRPARRWPARATGSTAPSSPTRTTRARHAAGRAQRCSKSSVR